MSAGGITNQRGLRVSVGLSVQRQTPKTDFGSVLGKGVSKATDVVLQAGQLAAPYLPGGAIVSAAVSGLGSVKSSLTGSSSASTAPALAPNSNVLGGSSISTNGTGSAPVSNTGGDAFSAIEQNAAAGDSSSQLMMATKQMQEMNQSFNLQYLQLQQKMQADNRQFTLMSNIMKTKHDTAKNAINNVR